MLQFWELDVNDQITVLGRYTKIVDLHDLQTSGAILSHMYYDQRHDAYALSSLSSRLHSKDPLNNAVLLTIQQPQFSKEYELEYNWGFVLQKDGKNVFICKNLMRYDSTKVVLICLDDLLNSPQIEYHYADKLPNRWKVIHTTIGFGLVCLLLDAANRFPIRIE
jgi:hypothetical protein